MSTVTVVGNVNNPEKKTVNGGKVVLEFSLAENHSKKDQQGNWQEDGTTWRDVEIWDAKAEALAAVIQKGDRVIAIGQERIREWTAKDGTKGKSLEMNAQWVGIIPKPATAGGTQPQGGFGQQQGGFGGQQQGGGWNTPPQSASGWGSPAPGEQPY